jgi:hypothetical protein
MRKLLCSYFAPLASAFVKVRELLAAYRAALVKHSDFDTWFYLVLYSMIDLFCWCIPIGVLARCAVDISLHSGIRRLADIFGPSSGLIWLAVQKHNIEPFVILYSAYWVNTWAKMIKKRFEKLDTYLTPEGSNPFASLFTTAPVYFTGGLGFAIGYLPVMALEWGRVIAGYADRLVDMHDNKPKNFVAINVALAAVLFGLIVMMEANPEYLDLHEIPPNWLAHRIANSVACYFRRKRAAERQSAATSVLSLLSDRIDEYHYDDLLPWQFRLLRLDADHSCASLSSYDIRTYHGLPGLKFEAVSYRWGERTTSHAITIDDGLGRFATIKITKSAHDVIAALFPLQGARYIWIDSICINQQSPREQDAQIPLMRDIYSRAERVLAHLGTSKFSSLANDFLARAIWHAVSFPGFNPKEPFRTSVPFPTDYHGWKAFRELARNEIWSRVWVFQEMLVAQKLVICNGDADFPWRFLLQFDMSFEGYCMKAPYTEVDGRVPNSQLYSKEDLSTVHRIMLQQRAIREQGGSRKLTDLLIDTRELESTRAKDKVYALLGLSDARARCSLRPDYTKSVEDVYTAAMLHCLRGNGFVLFSIAGACRRYVQVPNVKSNEQGQHTVGNVQEPELQLPSWVANFRDRPWYGSFSLYDRGYKASGRNAWISDFKYSAGRLELCGWKIDEIAQCAQEEERPELGIYPFHMKAEDHKKRHDTWHLPNHPDSALRRMQNIMQEMLRMMQSSIAQQRHDIWQREQLRMAQEEIVALTAIEDFDGTSHPASVTNLKAYNVFKVMMNLADMYALYEEIPSSWRSLCDLKNRLKSPRLIKKLIRDGAWMPFFLRAEEVSFQRKFALTKKGRAAMVPKGTEAGDVICIFNGSPVPHILRKASGQHYELFGDAYVHGIMAGEALTGEPKRIILV